MRSLFRQQLFPFVVPLLGLLCSATAQQDDIASAAAVTTHESSSSCTLGVDGTCTRPNEPAGHSKHDSWEDDSSHVFTAIALPEPDDQGYMDIGYGERQRLVHHHNIATKTNVRLRLQQTIHYMTTTVATNETLATVRDHCVNRHESCTEWAVTGECHTNPMYMLLQCAPACLSCDQLHFETRCPLPANVQEQNVWQAGDLDRRMHRILQDYPAATVLARPDDDTNNNKTTTSWLIQVDDFLTPHECDTLIELGTAQGYTMSGGVGDRQFDGTYSERRDSNSRTSTNTWCVNECYQNATTRHILHKLEQLTGIPDVNSEYLQLLRYDVGQFYRSHHDYIPHQVERPQGVRILTVVLYLNNVQQGGGTHFTNMGITCEPKRGRAVLWPSVQNDQPNTRDENTHHEALAVERGVKYAANAWFHQRDYKTPYKNSCSD